MMTSTTAYSFGTVILVPFPFTDQSTTKKRPAVVISSERYHRERPDVILMAITSQTRPLPTVGEVAVVDWSAAGLLKPSVIKPLIATIEAQLILRQLGHLQANDLRALRGVLSAILG
jgi:mRNA interferase MazF